MLLLNKYSPETVDKTSFHHELLKMLKIMSNDSSLPHIIFYGPPGSGKKTIIRLFLEMLYDKDVNNITNTEYTIMGSGNKPHKIYVKQSNYHIIIEPNNNNFDRYLVQDIVKAYARKIPLNVFKSKRVFKTVLINTVDCMSYYAQTSLRRTMEKYSGTCRFIMWCHSLSKVIDPLMSRCICLRVPSPNDSELFKYSYKLASIEKINMSLNEYNKIIQHANGNIKTLLWLLELAKLGLPMMVSYDEKIQEIVKDILTLDINKIHNIRDILYNIIITNINGTKILNDLLEALISSKKINEKCKYYIWSTGATIDHTIMKARRIILHLDNFCITVMNIIKTHNTSM